METQKGKNNSILRMILIFLFGLNFISLAAILKNVMNWSNNNGTIYIYIPLALMILIVPIEISISQKANSKPIMKQLLKYQIVIGIIGQFISDWLLYNAFHVIIPDFLLDLTRDSVMGTGWLSEESVIMILFGIWFASTFLCVIPAIIVLLLTLPSGDKIRKLSEYHFAWALLAVFLAIRWGGSWSGILHHLIYTAIMFPPLIYYSGNIIEQDYDTSHSKLAIFRMMGILFMVGIWMGLVESYFAPHLNASWIWLIVAFFQIIMGVLVQKSNLMENEDKSSKTVMILWVIAGISLIFYFMGNVFIVFEESRMIWLLLGCFGASVSPEILIKIRSEGSMRFGSIISAIGLIIFVVGFLIPYIANIYDPISTLASIVLVAINIPVNLTILRSKKPKS